MSFLFRWPKWLKVFAARFRKIKQNAHDDIPVPHSLALPSDSATAYAISRRIERRAPVFAPEDQIALAGAQSFTYPMTPVPLIGSPLQAAFNGLLTILQIIDRHDGNKAAITRLRIRLRRLSGYLYNAPSARDGSELSRRDELISLLEETSDQLTELEDGGLGYEFVTQALVGFSTKLDDYLAEYTFAASMQIEAVTQLRQFGGSAAIDLPITVARHCLILVDGRGHEHRIPLEFCMSFQQFNQMIQVIFCGNSEMATIQARYVQQGQYNLYIDEGVQVATRVDPDRWPMFESGTKIVMKFLEPLCESFGDLSKLLTRTSGDAVGQGGFCDVWKCSLSYTSGITSNLKMVDVAVKVLRTSPDDEDGMKDIQREIGIWKRLRHSHIVPFFGVADAFVPSRISLISSWQENGTLTCLLKRNYGMNCKDRLLLLRDIASGLSYLHSVNFVHGDLTGNNVLIDADGCARLTDFGLSSVVDAGEGLSYLALTKMRPGAVRWMAPELCIGDDVSPTFLSDIYSYGCIMLQTLSGCLPWSEIKRDLFIVIKLSQGIHPQRPGSLAILDAHWDFIMLCLSLTMTSRPPATKVLKWIRAEISEQEPRNDPS